MRTFLSCLAIALLLSYCSKLPGQLNNDEELETLIATEIQSSLSGNMGLVPFSEIVDFPWTHLLVLAPYSSLSEIGAGLEVDLSSLHHLGIDQQDDICLLVFLDGKAIVRAVAFPRSVGDFAEIDPISIPREFTVFQLEPTPSGRVKMRLVGR